MLSKYDYFDPKRNFGKVSLETKAIRLFFSGLIGYFGALARK